MPKTTIFILHAAALTYATANTPLPELAHSAMTQLLTSAPGQPVTLSQTAIILGTTLGCLETDREFDNSRFSNPRHASPAAFAKTLPSTLPAQLALTFHLTGPSLVLSAGNASAAVAIRRAARWMHHLNLPHAIAGGFDAITENASTAPTCSIALLLLTTQPTAGIGKITLHPPSAPDLLALHDSSLDLLIQWIQSAGEVTLPTGLALSR